MRNNLDIGEFRSNMGWESIYRIELEHRKQSRAVRSEFRVGFRLLNDIGASCIFYSISFFRVKSRNL